MNGELSRQDLLRRDPRVVKRYANRKLYDTAASRYVTLGQIAEMVRAGENVQVVDNATQEDKTYGTLALILSEQLKHRAHAIPVSTLQALIREPGSQAAEALGPSRAWGSSEAWRSPETRRSSEIWSRTTPEDLPVGSVWPPNPPDPIPTRSETASGPKELIVQESGADSTHKNGYGMAEQRWPRDGVPPSPSDLPALKDLERKVAQLLLRVDTLERQVGQEAKPSTE